MKNKKGFTLIELLAVIVILAIIALIATPIVLNMINNARKKSAESSAYGFIDAIEYNNGFAQTEQAGYTEINGENLDATSINIKMKGKKPTGGTVSIVNGKVTSAILCVEGYTVVYTTNKVDSVTKGCNDSTTPAVLDYTISYNANGGSGTMESTTNEIVASTFKAPANSYFKEWNTKADGSGDKYITSSTVSSNLILYAIWETTYKKIVYLNPKNLSTECNESNSQIGIANSTESGCMKFYVFDDSGDQYKMILDHNTSGNYSAWNSSGNSVDGMNEIKTQLETETSGWQGNPRLITADEVAHITGADTEKSWTSSNANSSNWFCFDNLNDTTNRYNACHKEQGTSKYAWLYDYTIDCGFYGCNENINGGYSYSTYGYWTSTPISSSTNEAWVITYSGLLNNKSIDNGYKNNGKGIGVRPVITIQKSVLQ